MENVKVDTFKMSPCCVHLLKVLKSDARMAVLKTYELAMKVVVIGNNPTSNYFNKQGTIIDMRKLIKAKNDVLKCQECFKHNVNLFMCIQCANVRCIDHACNHHQKANHLFGVNAKTGDFFCFKCNDISSHPQLESIRIKVIKSSGLSNNYPGLPIFECEHNHEKALVVASMSKEPVFKATLGLRGFINMGSTCFMSAVLQCIIHNPFIKNYYFRGDHLNCDKGPIECLSCCLNDIIKEFYTSTSIIGFGPVDFLIASWKVKKSLAGYSEQDAHEFWQFLIHQIHKSDKTSVKYLKNKENTPILDDDQQQQQQQQHAQEECDCITHKTFSGKLKSTLICKDCDNIRETIDPMLDLSLEIQENKIPINDLHSCLKKFTKSEELDVLYNCNNCRKKTKVTKQLKLDKLPPVLSIQLKRFEHFNGISNKIESHVSIPIILNMDEYTTTISKKGGPSDTKNYELFGIVVHIGSVNTGHYIAYIKKGNYWFKFDDATVTRVSQEDVLKVKAYLLFYCINEFI